MAQNSENCNKTLQKLHKTKQQIGNYKPYETDNHKCMYILKNVWLTQSGITQKFQVESEKWAVAVERGTSP